MSDPVAPAPAPVSEVAKVESWFSALYTKVKLFVTSHWSKVLAVYATYKVGVVSDVGALVAFVIKHL